VKSTGFSKAILSDFRLSCKSFRIKCHRARITCPPLSLSLSRVSVIRVIVRHRAACKREILESGFSVPELIQYIYFVFIFFSIFFSMCAFISIEFRHFLGDETFLCVLE
jgi:hypothetical protein